MRWKSCEVKTYARAWSTRALRLPVIKHIVRVYLNTIGSSRVAMMLLLSPPLMLILQYSLSWRPRKAVPSIVMKNAIGESLFSIIAGEEIEGFGSGGRQYNSSRVGYVCEWILHFSPSFRRRDVPYPLALRYVY